MGRAAFLTAYTRLLERAVQALKAGRSPELDRPLDHGTEVDLKAPALIPSNYLPDVHARLMMYKRIASADSAEALESLQVEMIDRFGLLPEALTNLFKITGIKLKATPIGVKKIDVGETGGRMLFNPNPNLDPAAVIALIQSQPKRYRFEGGERLRLTQDLPTLDDRVKAVDTLLEALDTRAAA